MRLIQRLLFIMTCLIGANGLTATLESVAVKQKQGKISLLFHLDKPAIHKIFTLANPDRIVVDFDKTTLGFNPATLHLNSVYVKKLRSGHPNPYTLRLVFEVTDAVSLHASRFPSVGQFFSFDLLASKPLLTPTVSTQPKPMLKPLLKTPPLMRPRDVIVVLDPGHGGHDPGALGAKKSPEKFVTLMIAKRLKGIIDKEPGMHAVLTRSGDYYVGLRDRLVIARRYHADIFISIHADAFINHESHGASVFALSQRGATSEAARWLAEKENYSELGGVNLKGLDDQTGLVRTVLIDLSQTATIAQSLHMGDSVLKALSPMTALHNTHVEQARFMVLKSPDIPSILIETGFISNPQEERNLTNQYYQTRLVRAIFSGIKRYFWEYPPHGSRIEILAGRG